MENTTARAAGIKKAGGLDEREQKLLEIIRDVGFGELKVIINDGRPVRIEEMKKSIKL
ncbi:DUF2292 domain-containing protein [Bacilliculturomica massiliensis]|uniref:DUF2292 domain-containing protein n=1 Tax=Bacilliculturomica massiliensis TaxID=1917867 RepID=UPI00102FC678|nr:DUF2292 domain-containing protein [Bacilliculturomica massiliensis]